MLAGLNQTEMAFRQAEAGIAGAAPSTGTPSASIASVTAPWRSLATRLRMTPPRCTAGSCEAKPRTSAAVSIGPRETSTTSSTGKPKRAANRRWRRAGRARRSAIEQAHDAFDQKNVGVPGGFPTSASSSAAGIAQVSRLTQDAPVTAAWNAGSM